jgi:predicted nucleic acid-binding protein
VRRILLDTVGLLALVNRNDQWHAAAQAAYASHQLSQSDFIATSYITAEACSAASRTPLRARVASIVREMSDDNRLIYPTKDEYLSALDEYEQSQPYGASLVDCISFQVMRRLGLTDVFSNDQHFATAGFTLLF